jgi:hypothetical protein
MNAVASDKNLCHNAFQKFWNFWKVKNEIYNKLDLSGFWKPDRSVAHKITTLSCLAEGAKAIACGPRPRNYIRHHLLGRPERALDKQLITFFLRPFRAIFIHAYFISGGAAHGLMPMPRWGEICEILMIYHCEKLMKQSCNLQRQPCCADH